ncbi:hypothetical protein [Erythrobacter sp.]|uniref:hypothetical protein n=1 Tax=Erythrobacter sp. TaxID=1042 RepID=UPI001B098F29|nr:hypothetical protein [Erythrobacter sp.]MBO6526046.1 hypothetical protein [Erythrobacter sp.]MBO6531120.1 hypothetical protein [Erythrobacter sp.]
MRNPDRARQQGEKDAGAESDDSAIIKDHRALKNQSAVDPADYPKKDRQAQSLIRKSGDEKE